MTLESEQGQTPSFAWSRLPSVTRYRVGFRAERPQRLPPLWTTALHGALDDALYALACRCRGRGADPATRVCRGECPYAWLREAPAFPTDIAGVQDRAPAPLVLAPARFDARARFTELREGDSLALDVTLIGDVARGHAALVHAALQRCARAGLGIDPSRPEGPRPSLVVDRVVPERVRDGAAPREAVLETVTPLRLTHDGRVVSRLDATVLWRAMRRRADALARRYGGGPLADHGGAAPFDAEVVTSEVVNVRRWSSRQKRRMDWPGVVGVVRLHGDELARTWPLVAFIREAQLGKGTSFGFGRVDLTGVGGAVDAV